MSRLITRKVDAPIIARRCAARPNDGETVHELNLPGPAHLNDPDRHSFGPSSADDLPVEDKAFTKSKRHHAFKNSSPWCKAPADRGKLRQMRGYVDVLNGIEVAAPKVKIRVFYEPQANAISEAENKPKYPTFLTKAKGARACRI